MPARSLRSRRQLQIQPHGLAAWPAQRQPIPLAARGKHCTRATPKPPGSTKTTGCAVQAELTQPPFDMPIAESELVAGYMTEYSGFRFLIFFIAEFATAGVFSLIASVLFLGGWGVPYKWFGWHIVEGHVGGGVANWMNVVGPVIMLTKMMLVSFIIMWARFSYPRFREDQLQRFAWKVLIPISLANIMVTAVLKVAF